MRVSFVTALAVFAIAAEATPVAAEEGTFTACLTKQGKLARGALGLEPEKRCRGTEREVHLQMGELTRFNFEVVHDPESPVPTLGKVLISTDEFSINAECDGTPLLVFFVDEDILISSEIRRDPADSPSVAGVEIEQASPESFFLGQTELLWYEAFFTPVEEPTYIVSLRLFGTALPDFRCRFSGEVRTIKLPELELVE
jgi:hypothetical protein